MILHGVIEVAVASQQQRIVSDLNSIEENRLSELRGKFDAARSDCWVNKEANISTFI